MRDTPTNQTCYDCANCKDASGTLHGFCSERNEPIGGLDWGIEDFDRFYAHIFPKNTHLCEHFSKRTPFAIRGDGLLIYASCVSELSQALSALKGVS